MFNAQAAAIFQIFPRDDHEMDDKTSMTDGEMKNGIGHKDNRVEIIFIPNRNRERGSGQSI